MIEQTQKLHEIIESFLDSIPEKELKNPDKITKSKPLIKPKF